MHEMTTSWNYSVVALSIFVAILGSYISLDIAARLRNSQANNRFLWTILGAFSMGLAIWSMHFIGMLAMSMPMTMTYDPFLSFLSIVAAIIGAGLAFIIFQRALIGGVQYVFGSIAMGLAISTMHYTGMASMKMDMQIIYNPVLFALSISIGVIASAGALWLAFRPIVPSTQAYFLQKTGSAIAMGLAISGMHYTGMLAAHYYHLGSATVSSENLNAMVGNIPLSQLMIDASVVFTFALIILSAQAFAERQRIIEDLRKSEQRFLATFNQAAVGIGHVGQNGEFLRLNQKYCSILGYPLDELIGKTFQDLTHPEDTDKDLTLYTNLKNKIIPNYTIEKRYIRKDSSIMWINLTVSIVWTDKDKFDYAIAVVEDISLRKQAEEALKTYAAKLEQSNKDLEQFATIASHDLQAPLRKVIMFSESLKQNEREVLSEEGRNYIERMQRATMRMQELISDLLAFSRINRKGHSFKSVSIASIIDEAIEDLETTIRETDAQIKCIGEFPKIEADEQQVRQIFLNLISNALKFHKEGTPPYVTIEACSENNNLRISVTDEGIGFNPQYTEKIFGIFERLEKAEKYPGTGVGLAIVQKIAERHNGKIKACSQPGKGSTFTLYLPLKQSGVIIDQPVANLRHKQLH